MSRLNETEKPDRWTALKRGFGQRCPNCGRGALYHRYLKPTPACEVCAEEYAHIRADDFPPYLTIVVVGHIIIPGLVIAEKVWAPAAWLHMVVWLPLTLVLMFWFLPRLKGMVVAWMWLLGLRGDEMQGAEARKAEAAD